jgi:hypothetical protein
LTSDLEQVAHALASAASEQTARGAARGQGRAGGGEDEVIDAEYTTRE